MLNSIGPQLICLILHASPSPKSPIFLDTACTLLAGFTSSAYRSAASGVIWDSQPRMASSLEAQRDISLSKIQAITSIAAALFLLILLYRRAAGPA